MVSCGLFLTVSFHFEFHVLHFLRQRIRKGENLTGKASIFRKTKPVITCIFETKSVSTMSCGQNEPNPAVFSIRKALQSWEALHHFLLFKEGKTCFLHFPSRGSKQNWAVCSQDGQLSCLPLKQNHDECVTAASDEAERGKKC